MSVCGLWISYRAGGLRQTAKLILIHIVCDDKWDLGSAIPVRLLVACMARGLIPRSRDQPSLCFVFLYPCAVSLAALPWEIKGIKLSALVLVILTWGHSRELVNLVAGRAEWRR